MKIPKFNIVLPQGKADKSAFEMNDKELAEASRRIFEKVVERAAKTGNKPVIRPKDSDHDQADTIRTN